MTTEDRDPTPPRGRPSRAESEDLLDGAGSGPLHELLAAASGPAHREEIVGEGAAVTAFLAGHRAAVLDGSAGQVSAAGAVPTPGAPRRRPGRWRTPTGLASALALAVATAGVAAGAAALVLGDQPPAASGPAPSGDTAGAVGARPLPDPARTAACDAWRATGPTSSRAADPAFTDLVTAAGGTENVDGFCAATASPTGQGSPPASAGAPGQGSSTTQATPSESRAGDRPGGRTGASRGPASDGDAAGDDGGNGTGNAGNGNSGNGNSGNGNGNGNGGNGNGGNGADGRAVGPPAVPPGQAERDGPANGRSVGPPAVPPGRARAPQNDDAPPHQG